MKKVLIGMSGGVDSAVAAAVLKNQGYFVAGATLDLWDNSLCPQNGRPSHAVSEAKIVCEKLGIPFYTIDFRKEFQKNVVDYFVHEYINGRTPNPCVACNHHIKFSGLLKKADELGFDFIATGHYAKISLNEKTGKYELRTSGDISKDQSYVLYTLTQKQLSRTLMPLGSGYDKTEVRRIAGDLGLEAASKPDSQEICFLQDGRYAEFIREYTGIEPQQGDISDTAGNVLGRHRGLIYYTIGQRKGIGAYGRPMFVMKIDTDNNTLILGEKGMEFSSALIADNINFISGDIPGEPISIQAKTRYRAKPSPARLIPIDSDRIRLEFDYMQRAVTPGQAVVFYDGDLLLGGATIISSE